MFQLPDKILQFLTLVHPHFVREDSFRQELPSACTWRTWRCLASQTHGSRLVPRAQLTHNHGSKAPGQP